MYTYHSGDPKTWIPKDQLVEGAFYEGKCRNAGTAQWKEGKFHYLRHKFGFQYMEDIPCPEDDHGYDVFFPQKLIEEPKKGGGNG